jgi:hypothetical protein
MPNPNIPITQKNKQIPLISCVQCTYTICTCYIYIQSNDHTHNQIHHCHIVLFFKKFGLHFQ